MSNKNDKALIGTDKKTEIFKKNVAAEIAIAQFRADIEQLAEIVNENKGNLKWLSSLVGCSGGFSEDIVRCLAGYNVCSDEMSIFIRKYLNWFKYNLAVYESSDYENKELRERVNELSLICSESEKEVARLVIENAKLIEEKVDLLRQVEELTANLGVLGNELRVAISEKLNLQSELDGSNQLLDKLSKLLERKLQSVDEVVKLVNSNMASMLTSEFMKSDVYKNECASRKGENSPRYRQDAPDEEIVNYFENGSTVQELATMYNMTENGIREKIKRAGKWENRRKKNK